MAGGAGSRDAQLENLDIYLDNNATTPLLPEVRDEIMRATSVGPSNPSSAHAAGDAGRTILRRSREAVAKLIAAGPDSLFFTSGGTEANNLVLRSAAQGVRKGPLRIATTAVEHVSVLRACESLEMQGAEVVHLPVDGDGRVSVDRAKAVISSSTTLVSVQWVNNETGVIQPVDDIGAICRSLGVSFHTDAAQAVGKLPVAADALPVDYLSLTAHKWHGPAGIGAVYVAPGRRLVPLICGGGQERGVRAGTENLLGIAGMGCAAGLRSARLQDVYRHMEELRDSFENALASRLKGIRINGKPSPRVCNTSSITFFGIDGQALVAQLDLRGVRCSQGSACEASRPEPSHVLRAMGLSEEEAYASVRFSFSELNTLDEVRQATDVIVDVCRALKKKTTGRALSAGPVQER